MTYEELKADWQDDCKFAFSTIPADLVNIPILLGKWHNFLKHEKLILEKLQSDYYKVRRNLRLYYTGKLADKQLNKFDPPRDKFPLALKTKGEQDEYIFSDNLYLQYKLALEEQKTKIDLLTEIIRYIGVKRGNDIRTMLEYKAYTKQHSDTDA